MTKESKGNIFQRLGKLEGTLVGVLMVLKFSDPDLERLKANIQEVLDEGEGVEYVDPYRDLT